MTVMTSILSTDVATLRNLASRWEHAETELKIQENSRARFWIHDDAAIHPVALLAHGFTAWPGQMDEFGAEFYKQGFHVIAPRLPGHGLNTTEGNAPANMGDYCMPSDFAHLRDELARELHALHGTKIAVGYSCGGALVTDLLWTHPEVFERAVLLAPFYAPASHGFLLRTLHAARVWMPWIMDPVISLMGNINLVDRHRVEACKNDFGWERPGYYSVPAKAVVNLVAYAGDLRARMQGSKNTTANMPQIKVIVGVHDTTVCLDAIQEVVAQWPQTMQRIEHQSADHMLVHSYECLHAETREWTMAQTMSFFGL